MRASAVTLLTALAVASCAPLRSLRHHTKARHLNDFVNTAVKPPASPQHSITVNFISSNHSLMNAFNFSDFASPMGFTWNSTTSDSKTRPILRIRAKVHITKPSDLSSLFSTGTGLGPFDGVGGHQMKDVLGVEGGAVPAKAQPEALNFMTLYQVTSNKHALHSVHKQFRTRRGSCGTGMYFHSRARNVAPSHHRTVVMAKVNVGRVLHMQGPCTGHYDVASLRQKGYDSVSYIGKRGLQYFILHPKQVVATRIYKGSKMWN